jgi:hypothetical protein
MVPNVTAILRKQAARLASVKQRRHELHGNEALAAFIAFAAFDPTIT